MQHQVCLFQEHTKNSQCIIISLCNNMSVCFRNTQKQISSSSSDYVTSCLYVSGTHKEHSVHHHLCITSCLYVSGTHKEHSVHHHLTMKCHVYMFQEHTKNTQFIIISPCNIMCVCFRNAQEMFQERTKTAQIIISPCNIIFVCFGNAQRPLSSSSSLCITLTACLSVSGMHKERSVYHHFSA